MRGDFGHLYIFLAGIYDSFVFFCLISLGFESFILVFIGASMFCSFIHAVFFFFPKICFLTAKFFVECFSAVLDLAFCDGSQRLVDRFFPIGYNRIFFFVSLSTFGYFHLRLVLLLPSPSRFDLYFWSIVEFSFSFLLVRNLRVLIRPPSFFLNFSLLDGFFVKCQRSSLSEDAIWADL